MTYKGAVTLANKFRQMSPAIQVVELFGSVRGNGQGRDADFLILVNNDDLTKRDSKRCGACILIKYFFPTRISTSILMAVKFLFIFMTVCVALPTREPVMLD
jgi:hypothetical protein